MPLGPFTSDLLVAIVLLTQGQAGGSEVTQAQAQYPNALPLGDMLMEYRLDAVLGVGGFGITYLARDTLLEKDVAIKEYFPSGAVSRGSDKSVTLTGPDMAE